MKILICVLLITFAHHMLAENAGLLASILDGLINLTLLIPKIIPRYTSAGYKEPHGDESFDFIIVGAGPSGAVLAKRLSEIEGWKILLLEAGGEPTPLTEIPLICGTFEFSSQNWGYKSEKQDQFCTGCIDQTMQWPHGKVLGGSSIINYMIYVRGNKGDYERWASQGNPGWSYEEVLPYFLRLENDHLNMADPGFHSTGGPLDVSDIPFRTGIAEPFLKAAQEAGHKYVDYNGKDQMGVSYVQGAIRDGARCSAEKAYLRPTIGRKNIKIYQGSHVTKVMIDRKTKTARGVKFVKGGKYMKAYARKEVILSAGGLNTPQILMLSGIGPREHLESFKIPVIQDLPVGQKMYDHPIFVGMLYSLNESVTLNTWGIISNITGYLDWFLNGKGVLTQIGGVETLMYMKTNRSWYSDLTWPNVEFMSIGGSLATDFGLFFRRMFNVPWETYNKIWGPYENKPTYQVFPILLHPKSIGYIKLRSRNPLDPPKFFANYFSDEGNYDIKSFIDAIREVQRINEMPALKHYGATLVKTPLPGCEYVAFDTDEYWECAVRSLVGSQYHQTATCKMGPLTDPESVVDSELRVHGVKNLRVVDTSVIPVSISAHSLAMAYMIGQKASDIIKDAHK